MKFRTALSILVVLVPMASHAWFLPYPKPAGKYPPAGASDSAQAHSILASRYSTWKSAYAGADRIPGNVSQGAGLAMLLAVLSNDRPGFLDAWNAAENQLWLTRDGTPDVGWYAGIPNPDTDQKALAATDANQDIALALVYAAALVKARAWPATSTSFSYRTYDKAVGAKGPVLSSGTISVEKRAIQAVQNLEKFMTSSTHVTVTPKYHLTHSSIEYNLNQVGGQPVTLYNPGYFAPGWYRVFQDFNAYVGSVPSTDWDKVISNGYIMIRSQPGSVRGLARNWSDETGRSVDMPFFGGSAAYGFPGDMTQDGILVPYRIGLDATWFGGSDATTYVNDAAGTNPVMFQNLSTPTVFPETDSALSRAMWGVAFAGGAKVGNAIAKTALDSAWSHWVSGTEGDSLRAARALLGGFAMSGNFPNIWADLKASFPDTSTKVTTAAKVAPDSLKLTTPGDTSRMRVTATFSKPVTWSILVKGRTSGRFKLITTRTSQSTLDTSIFLTLGTVGETFDLKVFFPLCGPSDTSRTTFKLVAGDATVGVAPRRDLSIRAGSNRLSIHVPGTSGGALRVRVRDLGGREHRTFVSIPDRGHLSIPLSDIGPGTRILEIVDGAIVHQGLVSVVR